MNQQQLIVNLLPTPGEGVMLTKGVIIRTEDIEELEVAGKTTVYKQ